MISLRPYEHADVEVFYTHQADPIAVTMAAFPARDRDAHFAHWQRNIFENPTVIGRTVLVYGVVAGNIGSWRDPELGRLVGYGYGREFWGRGIATDALTLFLAEVTERPLQAIVVAHNIGSQRVLEKNGFVRVAHHPPHAKGGIEELLYRLD